jgi:nicotinamidase-related amidase
MPPPSPPPLKTALLIIDMQTFFHPITTTPLPNILSLLKSFSSSSLPVIFTQHGHSDSELEEMPPRNQLVRKWGVEESVRVGSEGWEILGVLGGYLPKSKSEERDERKGKEGDSGVRDDEDENEGEEVSFPVITPKNTYDAFLPPSPPHYAPTPLNRQLLHVLNKADVERVVVCGVLTDYCVDTTARGCFNRGFETWAVSDACGSASEAQHERALRCYGFGYGEVLTREEVVGRLMKEGILR